VPGVAGKPSTADELNDINSDDLKLWSNRTLLGDVTTTSGGEGVSADTREGSAAEVLIVSMNEAL
jgi:hypothetical protein